MGVYFRLIESDFLKVHLITLSSVLILIFLCLKGNTYGISSVPGSQEVNKEYDILKQYDQKIIQNIIILGNDKTTDKAILVILKMQKGDKFDIKRFLRSIQRLKNTDYFYEVSYQVEETIDGNIMIFLTAKDKWSILPIIRFSSGGGVNEFRVGLFEGNFLGQQMEIGSVYKNLNGDHFGMFWFEDRYLFESHVRFRFNLFFDGILNTFYNSKRDILLQLLYRRNGGSFEFQIPLIEDVFKLSLGTSFYAENIKKTQLLNDPMRNRSDYLSFQNKNQFINAYLIQLTFGKINILEDYYHEGEELAISFHFADDKLGSQDSFSYLTLEGKIFYILTDDITMGYFLTMEKSFTNSFYRNLNMGGNNHIRGFLETRFNGKNIYSLNTEIRIPIFKGDVLFLKDFVITALPFFDIGNVWNEGYFSKGMFNDYIASIGFGLRFKIHRIKEGEFRIDVAFSLHPNELDSIVFTGLSQFF